MAVSRKDIVKAESGILPPFGKLSLLINPQKDIPSQIAKSSGLSNVYLTNQPIFKDKVSTINSFLELPKPVCLVACKGNRFDYKILRSEYVEANAQLPDDLLCVDPISLLTEEIKSKVKDTTAPSSANNSLLDTPNLNASGFQPASPSAPSNENQPGPSNIDDLNDAFAGMTTNTTPKKERYTVQKIYKSVINREPSRSQRTDVTAMMLLDPAFITRKRYEKHTSALALPADGYIVVEGKHEEKKDEHGFISRQFTRRYALPEGCNPDTVESRLSSDGVLSVIAPKVPSVSKNERSVPIAQTGPVRKEIKDQNSQAGAGDNK
ncbi:small heat shock protein [Danaus plexippus plexippus]|uniref:Small heat shock protein n=1 Tax=Danaus plexippus plexippus TaxID=278856 RepID=A0A212ERL0_DANPL|nr:small heat shock protein [Danaus plexippus plexippus]